MANPKLGVKLRALRRQRKMTQVQLAERMDISASYLNLIEHGRRALTAPLLIKAAQVFDVDLGAFASDEDDRVGADLLEAFADPMFDELGLTGPDVRELVAASPATAKAVRKLYQAYREAKDTADTLAADMARASDLPGTASTSIPSEEVSDFLQTHQNYFPELEVAAARVREAIDVGVDVGGDVQRFLRSELGVTVRVDTVAEMKGAVRRYDRDRRLLRLSEALPASSRTFQLAHLVGLLTQADLIDRLASGAVATSDTARKLVRIALANYFAGAVVMPYDDFLAAAKAERYDIELLGHRFDVSFEQVCHRLTTLRRPGDAGVPFHLIRIDIAGNISKRFSASGIHIARFAGVCPRWNVHTAFLTPGRMNVQLSTMPEGHTFFCVARTVQRGGAGYRALRTHHAIGLGCAVGRATELVYADGVDLNQPGVPVGVTCRLCTRMDCEQRAMPPLQVPLAVDEDVRGVSFYAPAAADG